MFYITGDTHGKVLERLEKMPLQPGDCVIVLGDVGLNFYLNKTDQNNKEAVNSFLEEKECWLYCVRGNHEERPEALHYPLFDDTNVNGEVYIQPMFPYIRYFMDGGLYTIENHKTLVIGGAYSIDKHYRLSQAKEGHWCGWFADEQLSADEMQKITADVAGAEIDLVLAHTCPIDWRPTDLFLSHFLQSSVDTTMELWMQELIQLFNWNIFLFGHYHDDRLVRPHVEMYYFGFETLSSIFHRWQEYDATNMVDFSLKKDPMFYAKS